MIPYATPTEVGDIIESAADPRFEALPVGSVLLDRDGVTTTKREGDVGKDSDTRPSRPKATSSARGRCAASDWWPTSDPRPRPTPTTTAVTPTVTTPVAPCDGPNCPPRPSLDY